MSSRGTSAIFVNVILSTIIIIVHFSMFGAISPKGCPLNRETRSNKRVYRVVTLFIHHVDVVLCLATATGEISSAYTHCS